MTKLSTFRLEDRYVEALDALAAFKGVNRTEMIRRLIRNSKIPDYEKSAEAQRVRAAIEALRGDK